MRKFTLTALAVGFCFGAQRAVLVEAFTSQTCIYCPSAAKGVDSLKKVYKDTVTVVDYVYGLSNSDANVRFSYYDVSGVPTTWFDAKLYVEGGTMGGSMYSYYAPKVNTRKVIPSPVRIENVAFWEEGGVMYARATVVLEEDLDESKDPRVYALITQRNVRAYSDGTISDHMMRDIISSPYGDELGIYDAGDSKEFSWSVSRSSAWNDTLDLAVWVQYFPVSSREVLQSRQVVEGTVDVTEGSGAVPRLVRWLPNGLLVRGEGGEFSLAVYDASGRKVWATRGRLEGGQVASKRVARERLSLIHI